MIARRTVPRTRARSTLTTKLFWQTLNSGACYFYPFHLNNVLERFCHIIPHVNVFKKKNLRNVVEIEECNTNGALYQDTISGCLGYQKSKLFKNPVARRSI